MDVTPKLSGDDLIITVCEDRIDAAMAVAFKDKVRLCLSERSSRVVLDLSEVAFVDSSGLGAIVATMKLVEPEREFELWGLAPAVEKVFRLTRMDSIMTIKPTQVAQELSAHKQA